MSADLTPPIRSESLEGDRANPRYDLWALPRDQVPHPGSHPAASSALRTPEPYLPFEIAQRGSASLQQQFAGDDPSVQRPQQLESQAASDLLMTLGARERDLKIQLEAAHREIESARNELTFLRLSHQSLQRSSDLLEQQHRVQIRDFQEALSLSRQQIVTSAAASEALRDRTVELEEERERLKREAGERLADVEQRASQRLAEQEERATQRNRELEQQLCGLRDELSREAAASETLRHRTVELEEERERLKREAGERLADVEQRASQRLAEQEERATQRNRELEQQLCGLRDELSREAAASETLRHRTVELEEERERLKREAGERLADVEQRASQRLAEQEERATQRIRDLEQRLSVALGDLPEQAWQLDVLVELRQERDALHAREQLLREEQARLDEELETLHRLLEDLPEIYERKFRQRLQGILEQQQLLFADNRLLRERLQAMQASAAEPGVDAGRRLLPVAVTESSASRRPEPLRRLLQGMRRLGRPFSPGTLNARQEPDAASDALSAPSDDGPPRAA